MYSLKVFFENIEIPALKELGAKIKSTTGKACHYPVTSILCASTPLCVELNVLLDEQFDLLGWILKYRPSQSHVTNLNDDCFFSAMSKHVFIRRNQIVNALIECEWTDAIFS